MDIRDKTLEIECIYFDMDGVLVDFKRGQREILKIEVDHFYNMLQPIEGSLALFEKVYEKYGDRCRILTGVPKESRGIINASSDKKAWVERYLSKAVIVNTVLRKEKVDYVKNRGSILIDDFSKNIMEWKGKGGTGILFTTPKETEQELKRLGIL